MPVDHPLPAHLGVAESTSAPIELSTIIRRSGLADDLRNLLFEIQTDQLVVEYPHSAIRRTQNSRIDADGQRLPRCIAHARQPDQAH